MDLLHTLLDFVLHLDRHLVELLAQYGAWIYALLFAVVFAETGLVVVPVLPGDSLLFALGALAALDSGGNLTMPWLCGLLMVAAILGNLANYGLGRAFGAHAFSGRYRLVRLEYLHYTQAFFARHGAMAIVLARFAPILRTFAPFIAGMGHMPWPRFAGYSLLGGIVWVNVFLWAGYLFGNLPGVRGNFGLVSLGIVVASVLPLLVMLYRQRRTSRSAAP
jgi:membrane-associated protein